MLSNLGLHNFIILDNQSTVSVFCNPHFALSFSKADKPLHLQSNGRNMKIHCAVEIGDDGTQVWFSTKAITNILSLKMVQQHYPVSYDCDHGQFVVHHVKFRKPNMIFRMHPCGLHTYDPDGGVFHFVTTVKGNKAHFTKHQIEGAEKAWAQHASLGFPSKCDFKWILQSNQIVDCPVTLQDAEVAYKIWGPNIAK